MTNIQDIVEFFNEKIPASLSCAWDNDGLMCCPDVTAKVTGVLCALDITEAVIDEASRLGCNLILTHHPLLFRPIRSVIPTEFPARYVIALLTKGISVLSYHTRLDAVENGVNDQLAKSIHAKVTGCFGPAGEEIGRIAVLPTPQSAKCFAAQVKQALKCHYVGLVNPQKIVQNIAIVGGEGGDFLTPAISYGSDVLLTGSLGYHKMLDAAAQDIAVIEAGHDFTERIITAHMCKEVQIHFPDIQVTVSEAPSPIIYL